MINWQAVEYVGTFFSIMGALLLATHTKASRYGWLAFLAANIILIALFVEKRLYGLVLQQLAFMGTSLLGIYRAGWLGKR
jgi:nicotinamide riboside transporter PnuC